MGYVYGDLFFLQNWLIDLVLLYLAGRLAEAPVRWSRLVAAATVGALYGLGYLFPAAAGFYGAWTRLAVSLVMVALAFPVPLLRLLRILTYLYLGGALVAGVSLALTYVGLRHWMAAAASPVPWWALAIGLFVLAASARWIWLRWRQAGSGGQRLPVVLRLGERQVTLTAMVDSGNGLIDPVDGSPVVVVEAGALGDLLPAGFLASVKRIEEDDWAETARVLASSPWPERLRLLPYSSLGRGRGVLVGLRFDELSLPGRQDRWSRVTVGLTGQTLAPGGEFEALLSPRFGSGAKSDTAAEGEPAGVRLEA